MASSEKVVVHYADYQNWLDHPVTRNLVSCLIEVDWEMADKNGRGHPFNPNSVFTPDQLYQQAIGGLQMLNVCDIYSNPPADLKPRPFLDLMVERGYLSQEVEKDES